MRRFPFLAISTALTALAFALPVSASAQVRFLVEAGLSEPVGSFTKEANSGYLGRLGLEAGLAHIPLSFRAEGVANRFGSATAVGHVTVVGGSVSAIVSLGGVGGSPYVLAGIGQYRTSYDAAGFGSSIGTGYHVGVGMNLGALGFLEIRFVDVNGDSGRTLYVPITIGLRM